MSNEGPSNTAYRYALALYVTFAAYFWYLFHSLGKFLGQHYVPEGSRFSVSHPDFNLTNNSVATVLMILAFLALFLNQKLKEYVVDVGDELTRVSWANLKETRHATTIVIGLVLVSSLVLFLMDMLFVKIINFVMATAS